MANLLSTSISGTATTSDSVVIGGTFANNAYSSVSSTRLMFGGGNSDSSINYYIGTNKENFGGNYTKLDFRWHTGIRMGAAAVYGGIRFFSDQTFATRIMSIGETDANIRIDNNLYIGGAGGWITDLLAAKQNASTAINTGNIGSQSVSFATNAGSLDGYDHSQFTGVLARYITTAGNSSRIRITAPFGTNSGKMFSVDITMYAGYTQYKYTVSAYMYSTTNQWYNPKALFTGDGAPDIYVGRDNSGKAYISIANGSYTGIVVNNLVGGYVASEVDSYSPWAITLDSGSENSVGVTVITTITSSNIGSQSVSYAASAGNADTATTTTGNAGSATILQTTRTINGTNFNGSANITTATWGTARTITIGGTGKSVNGGGNVSWTLAEIGAQAAGSYAAASHTHTIANVTGLQAAIDGKQASGSYLTTSGKAADSELLDGIDSSRIVFGNGPSKVSSHSNANEQRDSGFYENDGGGSNWPSVTWYNSINVRHSNQGNYHGFQVAMSYYDNNLWFRSYRGSGTFQSWAYAISSQNIGSQSVSYAATAGSAPANGGNSNTVAGLAVHTGRNNEANKVVRTDASGYIQAGWINTTSGDRGTTAITRIYASNDEYVRFYTPANFISVLGLITTGNIGSQSVNYATSAGSAPNAGNLNSAYGVTAGAGNGLKFWNGSDAYKISMGNSDEYHYGPVTDYSIKTVIDSSNATRGFTWGVNGATPIAALNVGNGNMQIAGTFTASNFSGSSSGTNTGDQTNISGNSATTSQRDFSGDISTSGQGRFAGWYTGNAQTGLAAEIGTSGGQVYIYAYNRSAGVYGIVNIGSSKAELKISGSTINATSGTIQQGGNAVIHAGNIGSQSVNYATSAGSAPNGSNANSVYNVNAGEGNGIRFWSSNSYKISMGSTGEYKYGTVTDYSIKTQMDAGSPGRGFTWGRIGVVPIASLNSTSGNMQIAGFLNANTVYANWFRATGDTGFYFESYGSGITDAGVGGATYGSINTYGPGIAAWPGYAIRNDAVFMARASRAGIFIPNADSWLIRYEQSVNEAFVDFNLTWGSDVRYKTNIKTIENSLDKVKALRGVTYNYKGAEKTSIGFIAQEMEPIIPEVVSTDADGFKGVAYANIVALLVEAMKEQQTIIDDLKTRINTLESK